jgi:phage tail-like protein
MSFSNLSYLYHHLPSRIRRDDADLFLKRFSQFFGETLDGWDEIYETFYQKINPQTAPEEFVDFFLWALFGWSWVPGWFTLARKRQLYADFATHLARRGTPRGIVEFLRAFSIYARVYNRPQYWGEFVWGEDAWTITDALGVVVQISHLADEVNPDLHDNTQSSGWGEFVWGESYVAETRATLTAREIEDLIRFEWPNGHRVMVEYQARRNVAGVEAWDSDEPIFDEDVVPDENSGPIVGVN